MHQQGRGGKRLHANVPEYKNSKKKKKKKKKLYKCFMRNKIHCNVCVFLNLKDAHCVSINVNMIFLFVDKKTPVCVRKGKAYGIRCWDVLA